MFQRHRFEIKKLLAIGLLLWVLLPFEAVAGDDGNERNYPTESEKSVKINIFADKFLTRLWPQLPESYKIMASISASMMVDKEHRRAELDQPPAPLVGVSLTIEW